MGFFTWTLKKAFAILCWVRKYHRLLLGWYDATPEIVEEMIFYIFFVENLELYNLSHCIQTWFWFYTSEKCAAKWVFCKKAKFTCTFFDFCQRFFVNAVSASWSRGGKWIDIDWICCNFCVFLFFHLFLLDFWCFFDTLLLLMMMTTLFLIFAH